MLAWLIGAETSFSKAFVYNMLMGAALLCFGAFAYALLVGIPTIAVAFANRY